MIVFLMIIFYVLATNSVAKLGEDRQCGFKRLFWTSLVLTPLIGLFLVSRSRKLTTQEIQTNAIKKSFDQTNRLNTNMTEIVRIILAINLLMFVAELFLISYGFVPYLQSIVLNSGLSQSYQFVTYQFLHGGLPHLFNNMFVLVMCGPVVERYYGKLKFILGYVSLGVLGALTQIYCNEGGRIVGASASVFGILTLFAIIDTSFVKMGNFKIRIRIFAYLIILQEIIETLKFQNDKIGHFAHIGGALFAVLFFIIHYYASKTERR
jgi:rhomboid protease GluP